MLNNIQKTKSNIKIIILKKQLKFLLYLKLSYLGKNYSNGSY